MTLRKYLIFVKIITVLSWGLWFFLIFKFDPFLIDRGVFWLFYVALWLGLVGFGGLLGYWLRSKFERQKKFASEYIRDSFRQSGIISLWLVICLAWQGMRLLVWWNGVLLGVLFVIIERLIVRLGRKVD